MVLGEAITLLVLASLIFWWRYRSSKSQSILWYSFGLALFALGLVGTALSPQVSGLLEWAGRFGQYAGGIYFVIALLRLNAESKSESLSEKWTEAFRSNPRQIATFFSKIAEGFVYCKIITDKDGKPLDWIYLDANEAYEKINGVKKEAFVGKKATEIFPGIGGRPCRLDQSLWSCCFNWRTSGFRALC